MYVLWISFNLTRCLGPGFYDSRISNLTEKLCKTQKFKKLLYLLGLSIYIDLKHQTHARSLKKNYFKRRTMRKATGSGVEEF